MKTLNTLYVNTYDIVSLFGELNIILWEHCYRCPEGQVSINWSDNTLHCEQNYAIFVMYPENNFSEWDAENEKTYIRSIEESLKIIKQSKSITYDYALSFLATYGHIEQADVYIIISGIDV